MSSLVRCALGALAFFLVVVGATSCGLIHHDSLEGVVVDKRAPDFTLTDQDGKPFALADQRGNEVALFFGYTHCPDVCPTTMANLAGIVRDLTTAERQRVHVAFVTVDPDRDHPATLRKYVRLFNPTFYGLTGSEQQLDPVYQAYNVWHSKLPGSAATGYLVAHGSTIYLIDPRGQLRVMHDWNDSPQAIIHDIKELLT